MTAPGLVSAWGLTVAAPAGWDVALYRRAPGPGESTHAVLHAGTFALPVERGDYGDGAVQRMGSGDVFVALCEFHSSATGTALFASSAQPAAISADTFSRTSLQVAQPGQAGSQAFFSVAGRAWCLYVVVGSYEDRARLSGVTNALLGSVAIGPWKSPAPAIQGPAGGRA